MLREIVLDTETTGLDPLGGHRIVEIGCIELVNHLATGASYHTYVNPERDMPAEAQAVHGLSGEFLKTKRRFVEIADEFLAFLGDAPLVIHNAAFDIAFLNAELARLRLPPLAPGRAIDTLMLSRAKNPAGPHSLDQLCLRYGIDNSRRVKHGALLDAELLAEVYLELIGGRQPDLVLGEQHVPASLSAARAPITITRPAPLAPRTTPAEAEAHAAFVKTLGEDALWSRYA